MTTMLKERELFIFSCVYGARKDFCVHFQFGFGKKTKQNTGARPFSLIAVLKVLSNMLKPCIMIYSAQTALA